MTNLVDVFPSVSEQKKKQEKEIQKQADTPSMVTQQPEMIELSPTVSYQDVASAFISDSEEEEEEEEEIHIPQKRPVWKPDKRRHIEKGGGGEGFRPNKTFMTKPLPPPPTSPSILTFCYSIIKYLALIGFAIGCGVACSSLYSIIRVQRITSLVMQQEELPPRVSIDREFSLWTDQHSTKSHPIDYRQQEAKETAKLLQSAFLQHFERHSSLSCLCMHHLHMDIIAKRLNQSVVQLYQLCGIYNRDVHPPQLYMMANPTKSGESRGTRSRYKERSVACQSMVDTGTYQIVEREQMVYIDWRDPVTEVGLYRLFQGNQAACIQLSLEEMSGTVECYSSSS